MPHRYVRNANVQLTAVSNPPSPLRALLSSFLNCELPVFVADFTKLRCANSNGPSANSCLGVVNPGLPLGVVPASGVPRGVSCGSRPSRDDCLVAISGVSSQGSEASLVLPADDVASSTDCMFLFHPGVRSGGLAPFNAGRANSPRRTDRAVAERLKVRNVVDPTTF